MDLQLIEQFVKAEWWVPRWHCGYFPPWFIAVYTSANFVIFMAYMAIPISLKRLAKKDIWIFDERRSIQFIRFIRICGWGHLIENVIVFVWPHYFLFGLIHCITAFYSVIAANNVESLQFSLLTNQEKENYEQLKQGIMDVKNEIFIMDAIEELQQSIEKVDVARVKKYGESDG